MSAVLVAHFPPSRTDWLTVGHLWIGNCAVLKPSEVAPAIESLIAELVPKYLSQVCPWPFSDGSQADMFDELWACGRTVMQWSRVGQRRPRLFWRIASTTSSTRVRTCMTRAVVSLQHRFHWPSVSRLLRDVSFRLPEGGARRPASGQHPPDPGDPGAGRQVSVLDIWTRGHQGLYAPFGLGQVLQRGSELRGSGLRALLACHAGRRAARAEGDPGGVLLRGPSEEPWLLPHRLTATLEPTGGPPEKVQWQSGAGRRERPGGQVHRWVRAAFMLVCFCLFVFLLQI